MSPDNRIAGSRAIGWLIAHERWLPGCAALAWWAVFYPGFIGEDSLINLTEARSGAVSVVFTAWWVYVVDALTLGTRVVPLLTLIGVLTLEYAIYWWIITVFRRSHARAITVLLIAVSPLVGALGIQVRHDFAMTSGLFLCAVVLTRTWPAGSRFTGVDYAALGLAILLVATRQNGAPTLIATALLLLVARKWRQSAAILAVAAGVGVIAYVATRAAGQPRSFDPVHAAEWIMADVSCLLAAPHVTPNGVEWSTLSRIAGRTDWPQERACWYMNPMLRTRTFNAAAVEPNYRELVSVWLSLGSRYPLELATAHAKRVRLFLPPLLTGIPHRTVETFLHSTVLPNDFGLAWKFPALAERARVVVRAWNAFGLFLAHAGLWLIVLVVAAWRLPNYRSLLAPTILVAIALDVGLVVAAPISEGRYGLFILVCGQAAAIFWVVTRIATRASDRSSMPAVRE